MTGGTGPAVDHAVRSRRMQEPLSPRRGVSSRPGGSTLTFSQPRRWALALALTLLLAPPALAHPLDAILDGAPAVATVLPAPGRHAEAATVVAPWLAPAAGTWMNEGTYTIRFLCPGITEGRNAALGCPYYILDEHDIMSQPVLLVDPSDPTLMAFNALHGGRGLHPMPENQPPTERSRQNAVHQTHTTFQTTSGGTEWIDNPYYAPDALTRDERQVFGEDNAAVLDARGRIHLASLYSHREGDSTTPTPTSATEYAIALWKANRINRAVEYHANLRVVPTGNDGANRADSIHMAYAPTTDVAVALWRESLPEAGLLDGAAPTGPSSYVRLQWSRGTDGAAWQDAEDVRAIGPCRAITNPLVLRHTILIGCFPGEGYSYAPSLNLQIHAIDTNTWTSRHVAGTPIGEGHTILVPRDGDHIIAVASRVTPEGRPQVLLAYSEAGERWSSADEVSSGLTAGIDATLLEARVTAAAVSPTSGLLHLVYMERYDLGNRVASAAERPEFVKFFAAIRPEGGFEGKADLGIGGMGSATLDPVLTGAGLGVFSDLKDSIVVWTDPRNGATREFVAFGDYGYVRFAEVVEENFLPPFPIAMTSVPPIPMAAAGANPALTGAVAGLLSAAMVGRLLLARRKATTEAPEL